MISITLDSQPLRFGNHKTSCNNRNSKQSTTLSTYIWKLKDENKNPRVKFTMLKQSRSYTPEIGKCHLCIAEKMEILKTDPREITNKRSEIMSTCRHKKKFKLENFIPK